MKTTVPASKLRRALTDWAPPLAQSDVSSVEWILTSYGQICLQGTGNGLAGLYNSEVSMEIKWRTAVPPVSAMSREPAAVRFTGQGAAQCVSLARQALKGAKGKVDVFADGETLFVNGTDVNPTGADVKRRFFSPRVGDLTNWLPTDMKVAEIPSRDVVRASRLSEYASRSEMRPGLTCAWLTEKLPDCFEDGVSARGGIFATDGIVLSVVRPWNMELKDYGNPVYVPLTVLKRMGQTAKRRGGMRGEKLRMSIYRRTGGGALAAEFDGVVWQWRRIGVYKMERPPIKQSSPTDHESRPNFWCGAGDLRQVIDEMRESHPEREDPGIRFMFGGHLRAARVYITADDEDGNPVAERMLDGRAFGFFAERPVRLMLSYGQISRALNTLDARGDVCILPFGGVSEKRYERPELDSVVILRFGTGGAALMKGMWSKWAE